MSASERGGLIDVPKAENTHLRRENVPGAGRGVYNAPTGQNSHQLVATWLRYINMAALYKTLNSLRGEFAIFAGRWRKTANIIFFDIRPTPSAHREPPLGEISGIIMELDFFRFLIRYVYREKGKFHYIFFNLAYWQIIL